MTNSMNHKYNVNEILIYSKILSTVYNQILNKLFMKLNFIILQAIFFKKQRKQFASEDPLRPIHLNADETVRITVKGDSTGSLIIYPKYTLKTHHVHFKNSY